MFYFLKLFSKTCTHTHEKKHTKCKKKSNFDSFSSSLLSSSSMIPSSNSLKSSGWWKIWVRRRKILLDFRLLLQNRMFSSSTFLKYLSALLVRVPIADGEKDLCYDGGKLWFGCTRKSRKWKNLNFPAVQKILIVWENLL